MFKYLPEIMQERMQLEDWLRTRAEMARQRYLTARKLAEDKRQGLPQPDGILFTIQSIDSLKELRGEWQIAVEELLGFTIRGDDPSATSMREYINYKQGKTH